MYGNLPHRWVIGAIPAREPGSVGEPPSKWLIFDDAFLVALVDAALLGRPV
ncbi:MAG: hypothetical protein HOW59_21105 [Nonomuraea sp.]|nr:hypothetical protein [Nonomuraea sp.]